MSTTAASHGHQRLPHDCISPSSANTAAGFPFVSSATRAHFPMSAGGGQSAPFLYLFPPPSGETRHPKRSRACRRRRRRRRRRRAHRRFAGPSSPPSRCSHFGTHPRGASSRFCGVAFGSTPEPALAGWLDCSVTPRGRTFCLPATPWNTSSGFALLVILHNSFGYCCRCSRPSDEAT
ncbi:hypothetical protein S40285_10844 [Stachybotrys chlorohalonatus IBT 40285]|uniref:Uncharacterized protein n=1 Tax=Stachybotrys chlorohalonatus (strain IBT 40285) TaxID=1283841 RepID=A0A084QTR2_STAC4|nr:hypothetical protein S40285_10844 [Stachybotrys chlorohalonata IBT 40285]